jgi:hypothetical protein
VKGSIVRLLETLFRGCPPGEREDSGPVRWAWSSLSVLTVVALSVTTLSILLAAQPVSSTGGSYAQWHFNESSGSAVADSSGEGRNGTAQNMNDSNWVGGKLNNGLQFDAVDNQYVDCGDTAGFDQDEAFSFEIWIKADLASRYRYLLGRGTETSGLGVVLMADGDLKVFLRHPGTGKRIERLVDANIEDNAWHHVAFTYDGNGTADGLLPYVDGATPATVGTVSNLGATDSILTTENLTIGATDNGAAGTFRDGVLDEAILYDYALSAAQVADRYNSGSGTESIFPSVTSASPSFAAQGAVNVEVVITGTDFSNITALSFGAEITVNSFTVDSVSQITANITVDDDAALGSRDISATADVVSGVGMGVFAVTRPPAVTSASPGFAAQGADSIEVIITGTNLQGATSVSFGSDIAVGSVTVDSTSQITVSITVVGDATLGSRDISVTTGGAVTDTLASGFSVVAPPAIANVSDTSGAKGATIDLTIEGTGFTGATAVSFGAGIAVDYTVVSSTLITAVLSIDSDAATGARDVAVVAGGATGTQEGAFAVNEPPTLLSVTLSGDANPGETVEVIITGANLSGATDIDLGAGMMVDSFVVDSATQITVTVSVAPDADVGSRDVSVTAGGQTVTLSDAFNVEVPGDSPPLPFSQPWPYLVGIALMIVIAIVGVLAYRRRVGGIEVRQPEALIDGDPSSALPPAAGPWGPSTGSSDPFLAEQGPEGDGSGEQDLTEAEGAVSLGRKALRQLLLGRD